MDYEKFVMIAIAAALLSVCLSFAAFFGVHTYKMATDNLTTSKNDSKIQLQLEGAK